MSFTNLYYKRTAGTPRACYICYRPTTTVLATKGTADFIYTCDVHLQDPGFASPSGENGNNPTAGGLKVGLSDEELKKVKEEWEEKQKRKQEKAKEKATDTKGGDNEKKDDRDKEKKESTPTEAKKSPGPVPSASPTHQQFVLHREIFAMRLAEHRKRRQTAQAKEMAPRLPSAPRG